MITMIYEWLYSYFFSGTLPAILAGVAPELCAVLSMLLTALVLAFPIWLIYTFARIVFSFGSWR